MDPSEISISGRAWECRRCTMGGPGARCLMILLRPMSSSTCIPEYCPFSGKRIVWIGKNQEEAPGG